MDDSYRLPMLTVDDWRGTPMGDALIEVGDELTREGSGPVTLRVIGGFALMERGLRPKDAVTDIDYVGDHLGPSFDRVADAAGIRHGLGRGWINNDGMLVGSTLRDFEYASGKLAFDHAFDIGPVSVEVLRPMDVLRMKLIAIDTSLMGCEYGGEFTRIKDVPDVIAIADRLGVRDLESVGGRYVDSPVTYEVVEAYRRGGTEGSLRRVVAMQADASEELDGIDDDADDDDYFDDGIDDDFDSSSYDDVDTGDEW